MNYSKVQFISWELNTAPVEIDGFGAYPGIWNFDDSSKTDVVRQCCDIECRVEFFKKVVEKAIEDAADKSENVLKVFMAPEFLFRGVAGAYVLDLLNGWDTAPKEFGLNEMKFNNKWPGLFGLLDEFLSQKKFKNWLFVVGTTIGASFHVVNRHINMDKAEVYNCAYIKLGGIKNNNSRRICRKHYKSPIDFLKFTNYYAHTIENASHLIDENVDDNSLAEGSIFTFDEIKSNNNSIEFGIEICLDHFKKILRNANHQVDIQLVPSCGMDLMNDSLALKNNNSYAVNCDGYKDDLHTKILNGRGQECLCGIVQMQNIDIDFLDSRINASELWDGGLGSLKISANLPLN